MMGRVLIALFAAVVVAVVAQTARSPASIDDMVMQLESEIDGIDGNHAHAHHSKVVQGNKKDMEMIAPITAIATGTLAGFFGTAMSVITPDCDEWEEAGLMAGTCEQHVCYNQLFPDLAYLSGRQSTVGQEQIVECGSCDHTLGGSKQYRCSSLQEQTMEHPKDVGWVLTKWDCFGLIHCLPARVEGERIPVFQVPLTTLNPCPVHPMSLYGRYTTSTLSNTIDPNFQMFMFELEFLEHNHEVQLLFKAQKPYDKAYDPTRVEAHSIAPAIIRQLPPLGADTRENYCDRLFEEVSQCAQSADSLYVDDDFEAQKSAMHPRLEEPAEVGDETLELAKAEKLHGVDGGGLEDDVVAVDEPKSKADSPVYRLKIHGTDVHKKDQVGQFEILVVQHQAAVLCDCVMAHVS